MQLERSTTLARLKEDHQHGRHGHSLRRHILGPDRTEPEEPLTPEDVSPRLRRRRKDTFAACKLSGSVRLPESEPLTPEDQDRLVSPLAPQDQDRRISTLTPQEEGYVRRMHLVRPTTLARE